MAPGHQAPFKRRVGPNACLGNPKETAAFYEKADENIRKIHRRLQIPLTLVGLTQRQVADMTGFSLGYIRNFRRDVVALTEAVNEAPRRVFAALAVLDGVPLHRDAAPLVGVTKQWFITFSRRMAEFRIVDILAWPYGADGYRIKDPEIQERALRWAKEYLTPEFIAWAEETKKKLGMKRSDHGKEKEAQAGEREAFQIVRVKARG